MGCDQVGDELILGAFIFLLWLQDGAQQLSVRARSSQIERVCIRASLLPVVAVAMVVLGITVVVVIIVVVLMRVVVVVVMISTTVVVPAVRVAGRIHSVGSCLYQSPERRRSVAAVVAVPDSRRSYQTAPVCLVVYRSGAVQLIHLVQLLPLVVPRRGCCG